MDIGGPNLDLLSRLLDASSLRGRVIQGNLANGNTPGFKRKVVQFEEQLAQALDNNPRQAQRLKPQVTNDEITPGKPDGNNVNMELEMNSMRENYLTYSTYATIMEGHMGLIDAAIRDGR